MKGIVDESLRALLEITVSKRKGDQPETITVWIDTAFNGSLVMPRGEIERLGLKQGTTTQAILADGNVVDLEAYTCFLVWFGREYRTQVIANDGQFPLLGTTLLANRKLVVDYSTQIVELD